MGKWPQWFGVEVTQLWKHVIVLKFREDWGGWNKKYVWGTHRCGLWKSIKMIWYRFLLNIKFDVNLGNRIQLHDYWWGEQPLRVVCLLFYENPINPEPSMESMLVRQVPGKMRHWDVRFIRDFHDWELDMVASFLHCLDSHIPNREDGSQLLTTFSSSLFNWSRA